MIGLKLNEFYEILGALKNCPAYSNNEKFKKFVEELDKSHWDYIDRKYSLNKDIDLSIFSHFIIKIKFEDLKEAGIKIPAKTDDYIPDI